MKITIEYNELKNSLQQFVQVGFMEAVKAYEPAQDRLRQKDVKSWLKMLRTTRNLKAWWTQEL